MKHHSRGEYMDLLHRNRKGFTVIEFILGMLIFSIVAISLYSLFSTGMMINRKAAQRGNALQEWRWFFDRIQRDLENARNYDFSGSYPDQRAFRGGAESLTCLQAGAEGLYWVRYRLEDPDYGTIRKTTVGGRYPSDYFTMENSGEETFHLVRETLPFSKQLEPTDGDVEWDALVLAEGVKQEGLKFSYGTLTTAEGSRSMSWQDSWDHVRLPVMVRMELTIADGEKQERDVHMVRDIQIPVSR